jgi:hypothetical protein
VRTAAPGRKVIQLDPLGRLLQEDVAPWHRIYTYDPRGLLTSAKQQRDNTLWFSTNEEESFVRRSYPKFTGPHRGNRDEVLGIPHYRLNL